MDVLGWVAAGIVIGLILGIIAGIGLSDSARGR